MSPFTSGDNTSHTTFAPSTVGVPTVEGAKVVCEVLSPLVKGDKVLIFHKKRRKGYRKLNGHRQQFTEVSVKEIVA